MAEPKWTAEFLDEMREWGDPPADETVHELFRLGEVEEVNKLLRGLIENDQVPEELPPIVQSYLRESGQLPSWADQDLIKKGEAFFLEYGLMALAVLACASLPECYSGADGAKVLVLTHQLNEHVHRRLVETIQMVIDVMSPGGLSTMKRPNIDQLAAEALEDLEKEGLENADFQKRSLALQAAVYRQLKGGLEPISGRGIRAAQKVRLMHAAIRHLILHSPNEDEPPAGLSPGAISPLSVYTLGQSAFWDTFLGHGWSEPYNPISQEFLAATLLTFSYVTLRGLKDLKVDVNEEQERAYLHCWNVVGHVMGIRYELLVWSYEDAKLLFEAIMAHNRRESCEGRRLTEALVTFLEQTIKANNPLSRVLPLRHIPKMLIWDLVGKDTALMVGGELSWRERIAAVALKVVVWAIGSSRELPLTGRVAEWLFRKLLAHLRKMGRGLERELFYIPTTLDEALGEKVLRRALFPWFRRP